MLIVTPSGRCIVAFQWQDELEQFYSALEEALAGNAARLDMGEEAGLRYESVEVNNVEITGDVRVENIVRIEAEESLQCHLDDTSAVRVAAGKTLRVKVVNDREDPVPIQDVG